MDFEIGDKVTIRNGYMANGEPTSRVGTVVGYYTTANEDLVAVLHDNPNNEYGPNPRWYLADRIMRVHIFEFGDRVENINSARPGTVVGMWYSEAEREQKLAIAWDETLRPPAWHSMLKFRPIR